MPLSDSKSAGAGLGARGYSAFRAVFGAYLLVHFLELLPWARELFSDQGMLPEGSASPILYPPNLLALCDSPWLVVGLVGAGAALSAALLLGKGDRPAALGIWFILACLFGRNPLIANPSLPYVGLLLLAHALMASPPVSGSPDHEAREAREAWRVPRGFRIAIWIVMAVGYSYSGLTKLSSPSWADGSAVAHILANPLARPTGLRLLLLELPTWALSAMTWSVLGMEILFAPLALIRRARPWIWAALLAMHLGLLLLIDFADLTLGMVMLHLYTFDPAWIDPAWLPERWRSAYNLRTSKAA